MVDTSADIMAAAEGEHFGTPALMRLGAWGIAALMALVIVIVVGSTAGGGKRVTAALDSFRNVPARPTGAQLLAQAKETEADPRRLSDAVRLLNVDRDQMANRLSTLERNIEELTGSINRSAAADKDLSPTPPGTPPAPGRDAAGRQLQSIESALRSARQTSEPYEPFSPQSLSTAPSTPATTPPVATPPVSRTPAAVAPQQPATPPPTPSPGQSAAQPSAAPPSIISPAPLSASSVSLVTSTPPPGPTPPSSSPATATTPATVPPPVSARSVTPTPPVAAPAPPTATPSETIGPLAAPDLMPPRLVTTPPDTPKIEAPHTAPAVTPPIPAPRAAKLAAAPTPAPAPPSHGILSAERFLERAIGRPRKHAARPKVATTKSIPTEKSAPIDTPADSVATKTEFAVDLGSAPTIEGLRQLWDSVRSNQSSLVDRLRPVIAVRESDKTSPVELHLVIGPLTNAAAAARLCASFSSAGRACEPSVFDGQKLAQR